MNRSTLCSWRVWLIFFKKRTIDKIVRSTHFCERQVVWVGPHWEYTRLTTDEQPRGFSGITPIFTFVRSFSHSVNGTSFLRLYTRKCKNKAKKKKHIFQLAVRAISASIRFSQRFRRIHFLYIILQKGIWTLIWSQFIKYNHVYDNTQIHGSEYF